MRKSPGKNTAQSLWAACPEAYLPSSSVSNERIIVKEKPPSSSDFTPYLVHSMNETQQGRLVKKIQKLHYLSAFQPIRIMYQTVFLFKSQGKMHGMMSLQ